jgi:hypothetical protein
MKQQATSVDSDTNIAVDPGHSEPQDGQPGQASDPVVSDLRLFKYMSVRDAALAAGVSQVSGNALQYRALFVAGNLADQDR